MAEKLNFHCAAEARQIERGALSTFPERKKLSEGSSKDFSGLELGVWVITTSMHAHCRTETCSSVRGCRAAKTWGNLMQLCLYSCDLCVCGAETVTH